MVLHRYLYLNHIFNSSKCCVYSLVGNSKYPSGFNENALSTFQFAFRDNDKYGYFYSLSDFVYQSLSNGENILNKININPNLNVLEILFELRNIIDNLDIKGSKIFKFKKTDLFSKTQIITLLGDPSFNTTSQTQLSNGYNNFLNVYFWCSTSYDDRIFFGSLDIRSLLYSFLDDTFIICLIERT
jgi:hypothetical protein